MGKKIVVLNGSPRKNRNTFALVKEFTKGAKSARKAVTGFFLNSMDIHGCLGCFGGRSSRECPCVQKDDMSRIYPAVKDCDVVVLAAGLFLAERDSVQMAAEALRKYTFALSGIAVQFAYVQGMTSMAKIAYAFPMSIFRKAVYCYIQ